MRLAARKAVALGKPWVLDPVGCGATPYRTEVAAELAALRPAIIRGNASEIMSLAGASGAGGRVSIRLASSDDALAAAGALARKTGAVVAVTGETDYATDGTTLVAVEGGDALMPLSTALGCALSATTAAFAAVAPPLEAAAFALAVFGAAGAEAAKRCRGPGHLPAGALRRALRHGRRHARAERGNPHQRDRMRRRLRSLPLSHHRPRPRGGRGVAETVRRRSPAA